MTQIGHVGQLHHYLAAKDTPHPVRANSDLLGELRQRKLLLFKGLPKKETRLMLDDRCGPIAVVTNITPRVGVGRASERFRRTEVKTRLEPGISHAAHPTELPLNALIKRFRRMFWRMKSLVPRRATSIPDMRQDLENIVNHYRPSVAKGRWKSVRDLVHEIVLNSDATSVEHTKRLLTFITNYALWAQDSGYPVNRKTLSEERLLNYYLESNGNKDGNHSRRATASSYVVRGALGSTFSYSRPDDTLTPYTPKEIRTLRVWANGLSSPRHIRNANTLLALTMGAGLTLAEMMSAEHDDITYVDDVVAVRVRGDKERTSPVLRSWVGRLQSVTKDTRSGNRLFHTHAVNGTPRDTLREFLDHTDMTVLRPEPSRLRTTWAYTLLQAGTSIPTFMSVAGFRSTTTLTKYLRFMPPCDFASIRDAEGTL